MTVKFETIAKTAPTDIEFTIWVSIPTSANTSGDAINWSDDTGLPGLWQQPNPTYTGMVHSYLASNSIKVPASKAGNVTITADAGPNGSNQMVITFEDWGANPVLHNVSTNLIVVEPGTGIDYSTQVTKTDGTSIAGAEVQWFVNPKNGVPKLYDTSNTPLPAVRGGYWTPALTNAEGYATVKVVASKTLAVSMMAQAPGVQASSSATGFFINPDDPTVPTLWQAPDTLLINGELQIGQGETQWSLTLPQLSTTWTKLGNIAYLYFKGNSPTVPWVIGDTTGMMNPLPIELPTSIVKLSRDLSANQTLLFTQSSVGSVVKSDTLEFGAYDT